MKHAIDRTVAVLVLVLGIGAAASAEVTQNLTVPYNAVVTDACLGEPVALTGDLHILVVQQSTGNGTLIMSHFQPQGVTGTGLNSGAKYLGTGITRNTTFTDAAPPFDFTFVNNFRIVGKGDANNLMVHSTIHMTVNANGLVTAEVSKTGITCRP
jgi:hypothetical protein